LTRITVACLDMAGTTVADDGTVLEAFTAAIAEQTLPAARFQQAMTDVRSSMGQSKIEVFRRILGDEAAAAKANASFEDHYGAAVGRGEVAPMPGAEETFVALREAGVLPDWNVALNARQYEFCENRHWLYTATIPEDWIFPGSEVRLRALGLDYCGWVLLNGTIVAEFMGSLTPHVFDLTSHLRGEENVLQLVFGTPPRWLGQIGHTSQMTEWKPRFNYFWD